MNVSVLVPFRPDGAHRDAAWTYVRAWYAEHLPTWQVVAGAAPDGPWCKALAVRDALDRADGQLLLVADADVVCEPPALHALATRFTHEAQLGWAVPHWRLFRLTQAATTLVLTGAPLPREGDAPRRDDRILESRKGEVGGGMVMLRREVYEQVPLDPRFRGWGQEDASWGRALGALGGGFTRGHAPMWHLWHPPQDRMSRAVGSPEGEALHRRYLHANTPDAMRALIDEFRVAAR